MNQNYLNLIKLYKDKNNPFTKYNQTNNDFYSAIEGYSRGNMFPSLYDPMGNLTPRKLDQSNPLNVLRSYLFAMIDLQLYLDLYPEDTKAKELFNQYLREYNKAKLNYETKNGPLTICSEENAGPTWKWQKNWPFEGGRK